MSMYTEEPCFDEDEYYITATSSNKISMVSFPMDTERKILKQLQPNKSPGPDGISAKFLNELTDQLASPLSKIFESSMEAGALPTEWKIANITPIYKGGERTSPNSFRPVSLTSICCKMMEKIIKTELMRHLEENNLLQLASPLSKIFESSMEAGALPTEWKIANINPIYKGGEKASPNNF
ncbi:unnamed protein product [Schistocephalus solidus]|uniref:Reverse transcriptase domain-containing protein n=1 Tax=Schistocephalus solidus TaxID=70667 RepID=A0A183TUK7_SCHSO|nr:unnamed protein product [Schistocephalus solidus]